MRRIYMDHHATTPVDPRVLKAMTPFFTRYFGNAASQTHDFGRQVQRAVQRAREEIAEFIHADPREIVFTSGATESNNLALKGVAHAYRERGDHIVTLCIEHKSVLDSCKRLETQGFRVTYLPVDPDGVLDPADLRKAVTERTILISVMFANNEIGTLQPIAEVGKIAKEKGILFHCDAVQAVGKIPVDVGAMGIDLLSLTAHKIYGPKGVGALYIRKKEPVVRLVPILDGGGHETGMRSGTLNVPGIVGFAKACRLSHTGMGKESARIAGLRDRLKEGLLSKLPGCRINGSQKKRLPNNLNISIPGIRADQLMRSLRHLAVSSGSACISTSAEPSYVLKAIGADESARHSSLRFGLGRFNTREEVDQAVEEVLCAVKRFRRSARP